MKLNKQVFHVRITKSKTWILCFLLFFLAFNVQSAKAETVSFLVDNEYDKNDRSEIQAEMLYESQNAYLYIDKSYYDTLSSREKSFVLDEMIETGDNFDDIIYPTVRDIFGEEYSPGIDNDYKITILFTKLNYNVGGYFNPNDEYSKKSVVSERSNEREMIYLNTDFIDDPRLEGFIAHEFQHMITWNQKTYENRLIDEIWVNESRSELASSIIEEEFDTPFLKSNLYNRKQVFLKNFSDSLTDWTNNNYDYGTVSIFAYYLRDQFGDDFFADVTSNSRTGIDSIDYILKKKYNTNFEKVFTNWIIANYISDKRVNSNYGYTNENFWGKLVKENSIIKPEEEESKIAIENRLENWSANYYKVDFSNKDEGDFEIEIDFNGTNTGEFTVPYIIQYKNGDKEVGYINLDYAQDGSENIRLTDGNIDSLVFIPSSQNEDVDYDSQKTYYFKINLEITPITNDKLNSLIEEGSLIKAENDEKIYVIENNEKRWIVNVETFKARGYKWEDVIIVKESELDEYTEGEELNSVPSNYLDNSIVKTSSSPKVYLIQNGEKKWIENQIIFNLYGFNWNDLVLITENELSTFTEGEKLSNCSFGEGDLVRGNDSKVYLVQNCQLHWIKTAEIFNSRGYEWSQIIKVTDTTISQMIKGEEIKQ